jgi:hypothetical protein
MVKAGDGWLKSGLRLGKPAETDAGYEFRLDRPEKIKSE